MKNLKDAILEKLKVDDINLNEFPTSENLENVIKFLKKEGFKECQIIDGGVIYTFNENKGKIFLLSNYKHDRIWFADTSKEKISKDNPVFFLIKEGGMKMEWKYFGEDYATISSNKHKVIDLINKKFGW